MGQDELFERAFEESFWIGAFFVIGGLVIVSLLAAVRYQQKQLAKKDEAIEKLHQEKEATLREDLKILLDVQRKLEEFGAPQVGIALQQVQSAIEKLREKVNQIEIYLRKV